MARTKKQEYQRRNRERFERAKAAYKERTGLKIARGFRTSPEGRKAARAARRAELRYEKKRSQRIVKDREPLVRRKVDAGDELKLGSIAYTIVDICDDIFYRVLKYTDVKGRSKRYDDVRANVAISFIMGEPNIKYNFSKPVHILIKFLSGKERLLTNKVRIDRALKDLFLEAQRNSGDSDDMVFVRSSRMTAIGTSYTNSLIVQTIESYKP